jgi:hypothetical protein
MGYAIAMYILFVIMIWADTGYSLVGFIIGIFVAPLGVLLMMGVGVIIKTVTNAITRPKSSPATSTNEHPEDAETMESSSSSYSAPSSDDFHSAASSASYNASSSSPRWPSKGSPDWDNSWKAGGLPRDISPYSDIDDPYTRRALEYQDFLDDKLMFSQWYKD